MSNRARSNEQETRRLVVAITDFLRDQLTTRTDLDAEDRDCLELAIQSLELAYGLDPEGYIQLRFSRSLFDIFTQVTNPVSVKDKLRADALKEEGNALMRRRRAQEAENSYSRAIDLDRWNSIYYCNRASARIAQQHYFEAISDCRRALLLNPDYAKAHAKMGQSYALLHRPREAARCFRLAVGLEPTNERYRTNLRVAESQIQRPDAVTLITDLLSSIFGRNPGGNAGAGLPASFMIITESHPSRHTVQPSEDLNRNTTTHAPEPVTQTNDDLNPLRYGVVDEGSEEQPVVQTNVKNTPTSIGEHSHELIFEFPILGIIEDNEVDNHQQLLSPFETESQEHLTREEMLQMFDSNDFGKNAASDEEEINKTEASNEHEIQTAQLKGSSNSIKSLPYQNVLPTQVPNSDSNSIRNDNDAAAGATEFDEKGQEGIYKTQSQYINDLLKADREGEHLSRKVDDIQTNQTYITQNGKTQGSEQELHTSEKELLNPALDYITPEVMNPVNSTPVEENNNNSLSDHSNENEEKLDKTIHSENKDDKENKSEASVENRESSSQKETDKKKSKEENDSSENDNENE